MRGYSAKEVFKGEERELLAKAENIVFGLPEKHEGKLLRCHEVARVVGSLLGLKVRDGRCGAVEHSWCLLPHLTYERHILDPYCVGRLPLVQLVDLSPIITPPIYMVADEARDDINANVVECLIDFARKMGMDK